MDKVGLESGLLMVARTEKTKGKREHNPGSNNSVRKSSPEQQGTVVENRT